AYAWADPGANVARLRPEFVLHRLEGDHRHAGPRPTPAGVSETGSAVDRIPQNDRETIRVRGEQANPRAIGDQRVDVVDQSWRPVHACDIRAMDRPGDRQRGVAGEAKDPRELHPRLRHRLRFGRVRQADRTKQDRGKAVDETRLVGELRDVQRRRDRLHVREGYERRELSTCSISFLTCWRSMNSRYTDANLIYAT